LLSFSPNFLSSCHILKKLKIKIYKIAILPFVLYGCKTGSVILREEHRLRVFENSVEGGYLDLKGRKTDCGEYCIMMNFIVCVLHLILLT
jgi:hypothetical protein